MQENGRIPCAFYRRTVGSYSIRERAEEALGGLREDCWEANWALYFAVLSQRVAYVQMQREDYRLIGIGFI